MSMNVYIIAERDVFFDRKRPGGGIERCKDVQRVKFNAIQTPTDVTYEIVDSPDPAQAYIDYVKARSKPVKEPIFADDDIFGERDPIGFRDYDWTVEHIEEFRQWRERVERDSYTVKFEVI